MDDQLTPELIQTAILALAALSFFLAAAILINIWRRKNKFIVLVSANLLALTALIIIQRLSGYAIIGYTIIITGLFSNFLVVSINNLKMPAMYYNKPEDKSLKGYTNLNTGTRLKLLADVVPFPSPKRTWLIFSLGDLLVWSGIIVTQVIR